MLRASAFLLVYDRYGTKRGASIGLRRFEGLLALGIVPCLAFGLVLFPQRGTATPNKHPKNPLNWSDPRLGLVLQF